MTSVSRLVDPASLSAAIGSRLDGTPLAVMLDVDGTLAPIAATPAEAKVPPETRGVLCRLVQQPDSCVVLVSGRAADDAARVAAIEGAWVLGNHGMELRDPSGAVYPDPAVRPYEGSIRDAAVALTAATEAIPGAILENKHWTLSLHYRLVEERAVAALRSAANAAATRFGLIVTQGRKVVELRPPVNVNKGTASVAMAERLGALSGRAALLFAGDDRTDEDAFVALRVAKADAVTIRVASSAEQDDRTRAEYELENPASLTAMLDWLAERRSRPR